MIDDCMAGNIDMVITKSISRFARNTVDCLQYIRKLKERNIPIIFEKENINTMDSKGEILITIMSSLAQQESQSLSQNVKLGYQFRFQQGKITVNCNWFLGYTRDKEGKLVIVPEEAEVVKRIYREYLEGKSTAAIAAGLEKDGILTGARREKWYGTTVEKILKNEKYIGDAMLQKTYTTDCLTKRRVVNDGIVPQYYVEDSHEAIITRELFNEVQAEIARRAAMRDEKGRRRGYCSKYALTGVLKCGNCGEYFRRIIWDNHGNKEVVWRCISRVLKKKSKVDCDAPTIHEEELHAAVVRAMEQVFGTTAGVYDQIRDDLLDSVGGDQSSRIDEVDAKLDELQTQIISCLQNSKTYDKLAEEIKKLRAEKEAMLSKQAKVQRADKRISEIQKFMKAHEKSRLEYDDSLVRKYINAITVYHERFHFEFKAGLETDVWRNK